MLTFDSLPQARIVRAGGQVVAPPPRPKEPRGPIAEKLREGLALAIGIWPLTAVMLLSFGLLVLCARFSSP